ncbi:cysteine hydrolase family protein [Clostridium luticellarii]|uniref:Isochorismatase family protein n=1 Tax=Clostridium luticellarii TaxID=1691940 RepID=A0A2T0BQB6_9CLOT|nr:cysteine hydrolase family protein [Clostridium luticellarii]MCI1944430.1 cysteine hydrolase family protein [Clostridium luticellarii]MCI1967929.1 cysteine hydrolase family protein [Clostridium luticellarii]MCI1995132.1 cysteine hydrolase family protein [Clostridium luticellarii]MCI2039291.1 cysteine hydrolase family protein [Clostridium luticellarii]PRR86071.1 Isochorismatase family protein [Clostridium luticellarii]
MKRILVVVDYQKDFVDGSLGFDKAVALEDKIEQKIKEYRGNGCEVVYTFDTHEDNYLYTQEGRNLPVQHCIVNTEGWNLYGKIAKLCDESSRCFEKPTFGSIELAEFLKKNGYDSVELVGVVSNICVISNAVLAKAALPEAEIIVDASCTASNDDSLNEKAFDVMEGMQIKVINR